MQHLFFVMQKEGLNISRSRGMFSIFQDKERFRFLRFVAHGAFFFPPKRWWEDFLDFLASLSLVSTCSVSGTIVFFVVFFLHIFFPLPPPDATFQLIGANWDQKLEYFALSEPLLHDTTLSTKLAISVFFVFFTRHSQTISIVSSFSIKWKLHFSLSFNNPLLLLWSNRPI